MSPDSVFFTVEIARRVWGLGGVLPKSNSIYFWVRSIHVVPQRGTLLCGGSLYPPVVPPAGLLLSRAATTCVKPRVQRSGWPLSGTLGKPKQNILESRWRDDMNHCDGLQNTRLTADESNLAKQIRFGKQTRVIRKRNET